MKKLLTLFLFPLALLGQGTPTIQVKTIADLVAYPIPTVSARLSALVTGLSSTNGGMGGIFYYDSSSSAATNTASIFAPSSGSGRWIRPDGMTIDALVYGYSTTGVVVNAASGFTNSSLSLSGGGTNNAQIILTGGPTVDSGYMLLWGNGGDNVANVRQLKGATQGQSAFAFHDHAGLERAAMGFGNIRGANTFNQLAYVEIGQLFPETIATPTDFAVVNTHQSDGSQYAPLRVVSDSGSVDFRLRDSTLSGGMDGTNGNWTFRRVVRIGNPSGLPVQTNGLMLNNNVFIEAINAAQDTSRAILGVTSGNVLQIGTTSADLTLAGAIYTGNSSPVFSATKSNLFSFSGSLNSVFKVGPSADPATTPSIQLANAHYIEAVNAANDTSRPILGITSGNVLNIGTASPSVVTSTDVYSGNAAATLSMDNSGNVALKVLGGGLQIKEGANARMGTATLATGTITVSNTSVAANDRIFIQRVSGTSAEFGHLSYTINAGVSFTINSTDAQDDSVVNWAIIRPTP